MRAFVLLTLLASNVAIADSTAAPWRDDFTARLEALALLQSLNSDLLSHDSATLTLDRWCGSHQLATPATIVAERIRNVDKQPTAEQRELLKVSATEPLRYRRVHLKCGERVLSETDNWYVPARLTKEMNQSLDNSDTGDGDHRRAAAIVIESAIALKGPIGDMARRLRSQFAKASTPTKGSIHFGRKRRPRAHRKFKESP